MELFTLLYYIILHLWFTW